MFTNHLTRTSLVLYAMFTLRRTLSTSWSEPHQERETEREEAADPGEPRGKGSRALHEGTLTGCWNTNIQCGKEEAGGQPDVVAQVYNPNTWEIEEGRS